jgi:NAD(P)-dependent dehydrogenase (short-subunit alcohol dehydrogenase family)
MAQVWLITGVSSGLGTEIALKALQAGEKVIGTVRSRQRAADAVKKIEDAGGKVLELDVTDASACSSVFKQAECIHGRIDVLVNNAGMSWLGAVEDFT